MLHAVYCCSYGNDFNGNNEDTDYEYDDIFVVTTERAKGIVNLDMKIGIPIIMLHDYEKNCYHLQKFP
jgi:hypothetical protein